MSCNFTSVKRKFIVGGNSFDSNIEALVYHSCHPHNDLYYDIGYNFIYNFELWKKEPLYSISHYLRQHARLISEKYDNIFLLYTGGTDSQTMLDAFIAEKIKNITLITNRGNMDLTSTDFEKNFRYLEKTVSVEKWLEQNKQTMKDLNYTHFFYRGESFERNQYEKILVDNDFHDYNNDVFAATSWVNGKSDLRHIVTAQKTNSCIVMGFEKPRLTLINDDSVWAWQFRSGYLHRVDLICGNDHVDAIDFYFSDDIPEIQIKLAWLKSKILEKIILTHKLPFTEKIVRELQSNTGRYYETINNAMGYRAANALLNSIRSKELNLKTANLKTHFYKDILQNYYQYIKQNINNDFIGHRGDVTAIKTKAVPIRPIKAALF